MYHNPYVTSGYFKEHEDDLAVSELQGWVVQVRHCDISDPDVSFCSVASGDPTCCRSSGSGHSETATKHTKCVSYCFLNSFRSRLELPFNKQKLNNTCRVLLFKMF